MVGGISKNSKTAGVIASALYFRMLIFSDTTPPFEKMPETIQKIVKLFTYIPYGDTIKLRRNTK